jgi:glycerate 2-kinase
LNGEARIIINFDALVSKGQVKVRKDALEIVESGIRKAIPYTETRKMVKIENDHLLIDDKKISLQTIRNIYVIGAGKGAYPIALALDEVLQDKITQGFVVVKEGEKRKLKHIEVYESSHPLPDERSVIGAKKIKEILDKAGQGDIVLAAITGGCSALVNLPADELTIDDLKAVNDLLLKSGANISRMNAVRKHLCMLKGGRMVAYAHPAPIFTFTLDTAPPNLPWPDLVLADPSTFQEAIDILKDYDLWSLIPQAARDHLERGLVCPDMETPKSLELYQNYIFNVADPRSTCLAAAQKAEELGYKSYILSVNFEGEARELGVFFSGLANEITARNRPFESPCALISAGETTVAIAGKCGKGGPNQETVLGFVQKLYTSRNVACVCVDTDGTDGPGDLAGGVVDAMTKARAEKLGLNLPQYLKEHDSSTALLALDDAIVTGHTGTNVQHLRVVVIE